MFDPGMTVEATSRECGYKDAAVPPRLERGARRAANEHALAFVGAGMTATRSFAILLAFTAPSPSELEAVAAGQDLARAALARAVEAEQALKLEKIRTLHTILAGEDRNPRQSYSQLGLVAPGLLETLTEHRYWDFAGERHRHHERLLYNGGHDLQFETLHANGRAYGITTLMRRYTESEATFDEALESLVPWPGWVLLRALALRDARLGGRGRR